MAGKFFVVGGLGANGSPLASIEVYTPSNNSWTTFAQLPSARSEVGCAASGNNLIVAGGMTDLLTVESLLNGELAMRYQYWVANLTVQSCS